MNKEYTLFGRKFTATELLAVSLVIISLVIVFVIIIPQLGNIGIQRERNSAKQAEVSALSNTLTTLQSANPQQIDEDMQLVHNALPTSKDVIAVFSTLSSLATSSNVQLRGFTIQVGELYNRDSVTSPTQRDVSSVTGFPTMDVVITVSTSDEDNLVTFSNQLYESLPIARINTVSNRDNLSTIDISFYYRPYDLNQIENSNEVIPYLSEYGTTLQQIR